MEMKCKIPITARHISRTNQEGVKTTGRTEAFHIITNLISLLAPPILFGRSNSISIPIIKNLAADLQGPPFDPKPMLTADTNNPDARDGAELIAKRMYLRVNIGKGVGWAARSEISVNANSWANQCCVVAGEDRPTGFQRIAVEKSKIFKCIKIFKPVLPFRSSIYLLSLTQAHLIDRFIGHRKNFVIGLRGNHFILTDQLPARFPFPSHCINIEEY
ncbi:uncharacterized protein BDR25DRAFT_361304 [Lindgomyces ingoldianus]|uniref:Uncharacterized protein n=1 Tax=Lindgomyces ingoldianus TaxID=673940 RepID=A0ACB6QF80_9PLEO|nr:uncharacterized protein BDR25DRAFT_361304 [Lindgomyces ingoldianus]KAF2464767.1 hypothetical protein BDR25DRAFT_361304 [Lindgomyces ingoldianus]